MLVVNSNRASDNLFQPLIDVIASLAKQAASEPDTTPDPAYFGFNDELDSRNNNDNVYNGLWRQDYFEDGRITNGSYALIIIDVIVFELLFGILNMSSNITSHLRWPS